jgi:translation elongation factor EF-G
LIEVVNVTRDTEKYLFQEFGVDAFFGPLQIAYRESITGSGEQSTSLEKRIGEVLHSAAVCLSVHPSAGETFAERKRPEFKLVPRDKSVLAERPLRRDHSKAVESGISSGFLRGKKTRALLCKTDHSTEFAHRMQAHGLSGATCGCECEHSLIHQHMALADIDNVAVQETQMLLLLQIAVAVSFACHLLGFVHLQN